MFQCMVLIVGSLQILGFNSSALATAIHLTDTKYHSTLGGQTICRSRKSVSKLTWGHVKFELTSMRWWKLTASRSRDWQREEPWRTDQDRPDKDKADRRLYRGRGVELGFCPEMFWGQQPGFLSSSHLPTGAQEWICWRLTCTMGAARKPPSMQVEKSTNSSSNEFHPLSSMPPGLTCISSICTLVFYTQSVTQTHWITTMDVWRLFIWGSYRCQRSHLGWSEPRGLLRERQALPAAGGGRHRREAESCRGGVLEQLRKLCGDDHRTGGWDEGNWRKKRIGRI